MSDIRDDELDIGLNVDASDSRETVYAGPVRGAGALKGLYSKANRKRLYVYVAVGVFFVGALIYTFTAAKNPNERGGGDGVIQSGQISGKEVAVRGLVDREEAIRYNTEQLDREQEDNIYAHPVITTDVDGGSVEDEYSPFAEQTNLKTPDRLSESGSTRQNSPSGQQAEYYDEDAHRSADDLARILIDGEAAVPVLQTVTWAYRAPTEPKGAKDTDASSDVEVGPSGTSCAVSLARAGTMVMGTVDIALNSDVGGPASLTIHNGKLRGARLIGGFERKEEWLRLEFNKLVMPSETVSVSAIGLDLDTSLNAVSGNVDRHVMYRYGWWGLGTVLSAIGKASAANTNSTAIVSDGVVSQSTARDSSREIKMMLGALGEEVGDVMRERINRPITVSLKSGDEVGVFFLDDACLENAK